MDMLARKYLIRLRFRTRHRSHFSLTTGEALRKQKLSSYFICPVWTVGCDEYCSLRASSSSFKRLKRELKQDDAQEEQRVVQYQSQGWGFDPQLPLFMGKTNEAKREVLWLHALYKCCNLWSNTPLRRVLDLLQLRTLQFILLNSSPGTLPSHSFLGEVMRSDIFSEMFVGLLLDQLEW